MEQAKKQKLIELREQLSTLRGECLNPATFDADGAVLLSHTIRWLYFKIEELPFTPATD